MATGAVSRAEFPTDAGRKLAIRMLDRAARPWAEVNLSGLPPELLIGGFFFAFLQTVYDSEPELLDEAKGIRWILDHAFQDERVSDWMTSFQPN